MLASSKGHTDTAKTLLSGGANVNLKNKKGMTALFIASMRGYTSIVKALLDKGADLKIRTNGGVSAVVSR